MNKRQSIPFILFLCAFLLWLYFKPQELLQETVKLLPNYIAYDASNIHYDPTGKITHKIFADKTTSFAEKNITTFEKPKVMVYIENKETGKPTIWQITSKDGTLYQQNKLTLTTDVWVRNLSEDQLVQTMNTEKLTFLLDQKEISSDLLVKWQGPQMQQQGIGMWASLITEELILKQAIKAVYLNENK